MKRATVLHLCPQCKSTKVISELGGMTGAVYHCLDCDYLGPVVIEHELTEEEVQAYEEEQKAKEAAEEEPEAEPKRRRLLGRPRH